MSENLPTWADPELDALATVAAREWYDTGAVVLGTPDYTFETVRDWMKENQIKVFKALFSDLRRPASRDLAARVLAERVCLKLGATAPMFRPTTGTLGVGFSLLDIDPETVTSSLLLSPPPSPEGTLLRRGSPWFRT